jgi:hypothetical protein
MIKRDKLVVSSCVILALVILLVFGQGSEFKTSSFCAYGTVFVEFEEGNRKWGTILLDRNGKPLSCSEADTGPQKMQNSDSRI